MPFLRDEKKEVSHIFPILYEDETVLVIDKPPGVVVNRAESVKSETVQDWAMAYLRLNEVTDGVSSENKDFFDRAGIVHRIDKETSGCLIIAKNLSAFSDLQRQFKERVIKKTYLAIIHGVVVPREGEIRAPVGRLPWNRERFGILPGGKDAVTKYEVESSWSVTRGKHTEALSLMTLRPETGRTHQIRVHLKYINHPILGDYLYAGRKTARDDRTWVPRVMLHAKEIVFVHPVMHKEVAITARVPDDMNGIRAAGSHEQ